MTNFPLTWPAAEPRTLFRNWAKFKTTLAQARNGLIHELRLLGATDILISSNVPRGKDGIMVEPSRQPADPGVAVYFKYDGQPTAIACDKWTKVEHNLKAIAPTVEAIRGIERWGSTNLVARAMRGFAALPPAAPVRPWREVLDVVHVTGAGLTLGFVKSKFRDLAAQSHPDVAGEASHDRMVELNHAMEAAERELAGAQ